MLRQLFLAVVVAAAAGAGVFWWLTIPETVPANELPVYSADAVNGETVFNAGGCSSCHAVPSQPDRTRLGGGLALPSPFGTFYVPNISPDARDGIGRWTGAEFATALTKGTSPARTHYFPAFPYTSYQHAKIEDLRDLFAYLKTLPAVTGRVRDHDLPFPFNIRRTIGIWKLLFMDGKPFAPDASRSPQWNRGAYLVNGLGHCGACHTPRNALGAERSTASFAGGDVDNWQAYPINAQSPAPVPWTADALYAYLRQGFHPDHGTARGPMAEVVSNLSSVSESDVRAIATYMAGVFGPPTPNRKNQGEAALAQAKSPAPVTLASDVNAAGASIYTAACATCHEAGRAVPYGGVNLALSTALSSPDPRNAVNIVLSGIRPVPGERSPIMPGFAASMNDDQISALLRFLRARFSNQPPWSGVEKTVADARQTQTVFLQTSSGPPNAPADATQRDKP